MARITKGMWSSWESAVFVSPDAAGFLVLLAGVHVSFLWSSVRVLSKSAVQRLALGNVQTILSDLHLRELVFASA